MASDGDARDLLEEIKSMKSGISEEPVVCKKKIRKYKGDEERLREVAEAK